ncbi:NADPH-dependent 1-acyldihydroxyacetone phosphate reductase [[Candida] zeylanoides]
MANSSSFNTSPPETEVTPFSSVQKVALVTGASSGIGFASSVELAKRGYKVYSGARRVSHMDPLKEHGIVPLELNVTSMESIKKARAFIESEEGRLDILFNNAGVPCGAPAIEVTEDEFKKCYDTNLFGPIRLTTEFSSLILKSKGVIAFTSSSGRLLPFPFGSIYSSSKAALSSYASTLALEIKPFGAKVVDFVSGGVKTEITNVEVKELKPGSVYVVDGVDLLQKSRDSFDTSSFLDARAYAVKVINDIEGALNPSWFSLSNFYIRYRGSMASMTYFLTAVLPRSLIEFTLLASFKLTEAFKKIQAQKN